MNTFTDRSQITSLKWYILGVSVILLIVYWSTAYRSITWWIGSEYPAVAVCLGVAHPPGSLILTILGWLVAAMPIGISDALLLNCFAGVMGVAAAVCCLLVVSRMYPGEVSDGGGAKFRFLGYAAICLSLGLCSTTWHHVVIFQPYILTMLFTGLLLLAMWRWGRRAEQPSADQWLFVILLLFGLDFSVHRTNLLLFPGLVVWILLLNPRSLLRVRSWLAGTIGLVMGLSFQLLIIPLARLHPAISINDPVNWQRFYEYVSLKQFGGGWLVNLFPRKAEFWSVQVGDYLRSLSNNFVFSDGPLGPVGFLPVFLALAGIFVLWRRSWKIGLCFLIFFFLTSLGGVFYFNTPEHFFWPMDRHYLPSFFIFAIFTAVGTGSLLSRIWSHSGKYRIAATTLCLLVVVSIPVNMFLRNLPIQDSSNRRFAHDFAHNILQNLRPNAILVVAGDNIWPLWYMQLADGVRPDVTVLSLSLLNTSWYVSQSISRYPDLPLGLSEEEAWDIGPRQWQDSVVTIAVTPGAVQSTDSLHVRVAPTVADQYLMPQDLVLLQMLKENQFRRPIYITQPLLWLMPHTRPEGLVYHIVAEDTAQIDLDVLRHNLLNQYSYDGLADSSIPMDKMTRWMATSLYQGFLVLAQSELQEGDTEACRRTLEALEQRVPLDRVNPPEHLTEFLKVLRTEVGEQ